MRRFAFWIVFLAVSALVGTAWAGEDKAEPPLRLELDLVDGSLVIGIPGIESVPVQTSYAKLEVPLKQIRAIRIDADHEMASLDLQNGDKLKGVINLEPIKLETEFGKVSVAIEHIRSLRVMSGCGVLPATFKEGLVLHYAFDKDEGDQVTDLSGKGHHGKVHGATWAAARSGNGAYEFDGQSTSIEVGPTDIFKTQGQLSGSAWVRRVSRDSIVLSNYRGGSAYAGQFFFEIDGVGMLDLALGQGGDSGFLRYRSAKADLIPAGEWHHIAFVYDERLGAGKKVRLFVDGEEIGDYVIPGEGVGGVVLQTGDSMKLMSHRDVGTWHSKGALDEVMLWHRALTENEIRQIYDAQK